MPTQSQNDSLLSFDMLCCLEVDVDFLAKNIRAPALKGNTSNYDLRADPGAKISSLRNTRKR